MSEMSSDLTPPLLADMFNVHQGRMSDKWEQYFDIYQFELDSFRRAERAVALLEIGVQNGGSLELWKAFLPEGSVIVGLDIDPRCAEMTMPEGITIITGDATDSAALAQSPVDLFDIIIDDGSHLPEHVRRTFGHLLGRLRPGGLYIVEDVHCSYWSRYGGGLGRRNSVAEWGKAFIDALNADHIEPEDRNAMAESPWLDEMNRQIGRVTFYDSIMVIQTRREPKLSPYQRVLGGNMAAIHDPVAWWNGLSPRERETVRITEAALVHMEASVTPPADDKPVDESTPENRGGTD